MLRSFFAVSVLCALPLAAYANEVFSYKGNVAYDGTLSLPIELSAARAEDGGLDVTIHVGLEPVLPLLNTALKAELDDVQSTCENRVSVGDPATSVEATEMAVSVPVTYELWGCRKVLGRNVEKKILTENGVVRSWVQPVIQEGRLQLELTRLQVDGLSEAAKVLNPEAVIRQEVQASIDKLNNNPSFADLPQPIRDGGFAYIAAELSNAGQPSLAVSITGPGSGLALPTLMSTFSQ